MIWEELIKIALIGTERGKLPAEVEQALARIGIDTDADPARVVLEAAALYHQLRRAGFPLTPFEGERPPMPDEAEEKRAAPSGTSARHLGLILEGPYRPALAEYLRLLRQYQKRIPAEHQPALFYRCLQSPALWKAVQGNLDEPERWLLRQNPDWAPLTDSPDAETWPDASHDQRLALLRYIRRTQPEAAAALLESSWKETPYPEKQALLREMEQQPGAYDETFLEACLDDSRKEVRTAAALLLARLPASALQGRLFARARALFREDTEKGLRLELPGKNDEALKRDGIGTGRKSYPGGKRAALAYDILCRLPPKRWEQHFNRPTVETLRLLAGSNQKKLLLDALANAAVLHQDHRWIEAILRYWWRTGDEEAWGGSAGKLLMENLPDPVFNEIALQHLKQNPGFIEEKSFLYLLLCQGEQPWGRALAQLVLTGFQQWLSGARAYYWNLWHYKRILAAAAYRTEPELLESFRAGWDTRSPVWHRWEKDVEWLLRVLAFRKEMQEAMK
ncbi:MAG: hypothetical protein H6559_12675 [Lewinellaceae bacterium]|nr:hypothetical protein [Lewinellaceae bacterium]